MILIQKYVFIFSDDSGNWISAIDTANLSVTQAA